MGTTSCYFCEDPATHECPTCGRFYCEEHGEGSCLRCLAPETALPAAWAYRGSLLALVAGAAVTVYLIASPPQSREISGAARPAATAGPTSTIDVAPRTSTPAGPTGTPQPGSTVVVTGTPATTAAPTRALRTYTVQPGDVLSSIAGQLGASVDALLALNPGLNPDVLMPGQVINIPEPR